MDALPSQGARVRWLVAGAFLPSPPDDLPSADAAAFAERLGRAAHGLSVAVPDRIGSGGADAAHRLSFDGPGAFTLDRVVDAIPDLRALRAVHDALSGGSAYGP